MDGIYHVGRLLMFPGVVSNSGDRTLETFVGAEIRSGAGGASDTSLMPTMNNLNRG